MKTIWWLAIFSVSLLVGDLAAGEGRPGRGEGPRPKKDQERLRERERERKKDCDSSEGQERLRERERERKKDCDSSEGQERLRERERERKKDCDSSEDRERLREQNREQNREQREQRQEQPGERREQGIDQRQENQAKRIQHGINKGFLTEAEATALQNQQKTIADLEASYKSDGKLNGKEAKDLHQALREASLCIWAEKHDTEGKQMPTYRFGKNVVAKDSLTQKLQAGQEINVTEARAITKDFRQMMRIKHQLATQDLPPAQRLILQNEYDNLLNQYFETH